MSRGKCLHIKQSDVLLAYTVGFILILHGCVNKISDVTAIFHKTFHSNK